ncbi:hypothetical protein GCM10010252_76090 [Streptomyces aureoverticillatus]|nr:hypothetical protein GCM10010252_76090 [Streptomyces aureoverticillatus]
MEMTVQLTIDCSDPQRMVTFWAEALGYVPEPPPGGHASWRTYWAAAGVPEAELPAGAGDIPESIIDPAGRGPRMWFQQVPEPKVAKNRWHFDARPVPCDREIGSPRCPAHALELRGQITSTWCHLNCRLVRPVAGRRGAVGTHGW